MSKLILLTVLFLSSCAPPWYKKPSPTEASYFDQLNKKLKLKKIRVVLSSGDSLEARQVLFGQDSTSWLRVKNRERETVATSSIEELWVKKNHGGKGALIGWLAGGVVGYVWTAAETDCEDTSDVCWSGPIINTAGGILVSLPGVFAGAVAGGLIPKWEEVTDFPLAIGNVEK